MAYPDNPHYQFPFQMINGTTAAVREQDDPDEIIDCCQVILRTRRGTRLDLPDFGLLEQTFKDGGANVAEIRNALVRAEPRAEYAISVRPDQFDAMISRVLVEVRGKTDA